MSAADVLARIQEIRSVFAPPAQPTPTASPSTPVSGAFAGQLQGAQAAAGMTSHALPSTAGAAAPGEVPSELRALIQQAAQANGVDPALVAAVARAESGFNPAATSPAGAQGLMQLMPSTARGLGVTNAFDPAQSLNGGAKYLRAQLAATATRPLPWPPTTPGRAQWSGRAASLPMPRTRAT